MDESAAYQRPSAQQVFEQSAIRDENGTVIGTINKDGLAEIFQYQNTREGQREIQSRYLEQERMKTRSDIFNRLMESEGQNADGTPRPVPSARIRELWAEAELFVSGPKQSDQAPAMTEREAVKPVFQHPTLGVITQGDIAQTAIDNGITEQEVIQILQGNGASPVGQQDQNVSIRDILMGVR